MKEYKIELRTKDGVFTPKDKNLNEKRKEIGNFLRGNLGFSIESKKRFNNFLDFLLYTLKKDGEVKIIRDTFYFKSLVIVTSLTIKEKKSDKSPYNLKGENVKEKRKEQEIVRIRKNKERKELLTKIFSTLEELKREMNFKREVFKIVKKSLRLLDSSIFSLGKVFVFNNLIGIPLEDGKILKVSLKEKNASIGKRTFAFDSFCLGNFLLNEKSLEDRKIEDLETIKETLKELLKRYRKEG